MIFEPNGDDYFMEIKYVKDETGNEIDVARHPKEIIRINCEKKGEREGVSWNFEHSRL